MPNNSCNPHNAVAKLAGVMDAGGITTTEAALNNLDDNAKMLFNQIKSQSSSQALQHTAPKAAISADEIIESMTDTESPEGQLSLKEKVRGGLMDLLKPTDYLPENVTSPVFEYLNDFFAQNHTNLGAARSQYKAGIRQVLDKIASDVDNLTPEAKGQAAHWMRDLREGYPFYGKSGTIYDKVKGNVISNALDFSGTILAGNPLEFMIKAPSVYGITPTFKGLINLTKETKGNLWSTIPRLQEAGVYGMERLPVKKVLGSTHLASLQNAYNAVNEKLMNVTDRPLKNLAFAVGEAKNGDGLEAVEKIAFKNRWGNDPRLGRSNGDAITLMNYTLNTYHMMGGMAKGLATPGQRLEATRQLGMWIGLTSMVGGGAAVIPAPLSAILRGNDGYKEWEDANLNTVGKLVQPGAISFGVGGEMINRAGEAWSRGLKKGTDKLEDGDTTGAMLDFADGGLSLMTLLTRSPLGNLRVQKLLRSTRDLFEGDIDYDEYKQKTGETILPALKQAK